MLLMLGGAESFETSRIKTEESLKYSLAQEHLACLIAVRMGRLCKPYEANIKNDFIIIKVSAYR